jgi:CheY-like chemotaxis protein
MQRILVVDDDPAITSVLKRGLSYEGFIVDTAGSGTEALERAREQYPDLVILDVMMPDLSGLEVLARLRAADPELPIHRALHDQRATAPAAETLDRHGHTQGLHLRIPPFGRGFHLHYPSPG